jgi:hypothetical protein
MHQQMCMVCYLCQTKVLCDGRIFTCHLQYFHKGMTHQKYLDCVKGIVSIPLIHSKDIGNFCEFTCPKCHVVLKPWFEMARHLTILGHGEIQSDTKRRLMTKHVLHECNICHKSILCDKNSYNSHMRHYHKMTANTYAQQFGIACKTEYLPNPNEFVKKHSFLHASRNMGSR